MGNGTRFFSTTTADKRSALENAWEDAAANLNGDLRKQLRCKLREADGSTEGGSVVQSSSSNGHSGSYFEPGTGAPAPVEIIRLWQDLVDRYDKSKNFLLFCAKYGLDAFKQKDFGSFSKDTPEAVPPVTIDGPCWENLCAQFSIGTDKVVGVAVSDSAVFLWMMVNLFPVTETRSDYGSLRLSGGPQYV